MNHRRLAQVTAAVCSLGLAGVATTPVFARTDAKKAKHARHHRHHAKHHRRHHRAKHVRTPVARPPAQSAVADYMSGPTHVQFNAHRAAGAPETSATGFFHAEATAGSAALMTLAGPVTCLDVVGNHMGLFYPVTSVTPTAEGALVKGVYIYAQTDAGGKPQSFAFKTTTSTTTTSCSPAPGVLPITSGTLKLSS